MKILAGQKIQRKSNEIVIEIAAEQPCGGKILNKKWRNCYQKSHRAALQGKKSKEKVMKLL